MSNALVKRKSRRNPVARRNVIFLAPLLPLVPFVIGGVAIYSIYKNVSGKAEDVSEMVKDLARPVAMVGAAAGFASMKFAKQPLTVQLAGGVFGYFLGRMVEPLLGRAALKRADVPEAYVKQLMAEGMTQTEAIEAAIKKKNACKTSTFTYYWDDACEIPGMTN